MDNFSYTKGKDYNPSDNYAYVKNPLLSETEIKGGSKNKIMYIDLVNIGNFNNFGYKGGAYTTYNLRFENFINSLQKHFEDVFLRIKELKNHTSN